MISSTSRRKLIRQRRTSENHRLVAVDQSFSNFAMVLFENTIPIDRVVFHTGDPTAKKNKFKEYGEYFETPHLQLDYIIDLMMKKMIEWNPNDFCLEGLAFSAKGSSERQLGALYFGTMVMLHRELGYEYDNIHTVTPNQAKNIGRDFLVGLDQYEREKKGGAIIKLKSGKPKKNLMDKAAMLRALLNTDYAWLVDGYTRDGLVASRKIETGIEDIPDAFFIGLFILETMYNHKLPRPKAY